MADTIEELTALVRESIATNKAMHESAATRSAVDARVQADQVATMRAEINERHNALAAGLTNLNARFTTEIEKIDKTAANAETTARKAMASFDEITVATQEQWRGVMAGQEMLARMLEIQNEDKRRTEEAMKLERQQESLAAKRMADEKEKALKLAAEQAKAEAEAKAAKDKADADERERIRIHKENRQKIWAPVLQAVAIAAFTSGVAYATVKIGNQNTEAKLNAHSEQLSKIETHVESVAQAVGTVEPTLSTPASSASSNRMPASTAPVH